MMIHVNTQERVFVIADGHPVRYLGPGRYRIWMPFAAIQVVRLNTSALVVELDTEQLALVPASDIALVTVASGQRAIVYRKGRPARWLGVGQHQVWTTERMRSPRANDAQSTVSAVAIEIVDTQITQTDPLRAELRPLVPDADYVEAIAADGLVVLRYVDGVLNAILPAGRHAAWTTIHKVQLVVLDLRERLLHVTGQEVMTKDRVTLRLNLSAAFRVVDARRLATVARAPDDVLYLAMQLAAREAVATRTLDELLAERESVATAMNAEVRARIEVVGLELVGFGIKDVVLPGEMKTLLNRVIEAQKEAEANVILRREETAATRSMAQTAKVLAENPLLVRLKELEAYKDLASKVGQLHVVLGESAMPTLQLKGS